MDWRNPFEDFRDKYLSFKNVKAYKLFLWRYNYIPYSVNNEYREVVKKMWNGEEVSLDSFCMAYRDMKVQKGVQPWITKFFNAKFSLHIGVSIWKGWLPLLFVGIVWRWDDYRYFQAGGFWGCEGAYDSQTNTWERAVICGKLRFADSKKEYIDGGNLDVFGNYEGLV
jgi:hypothetical protein